MPPGVASPSASHAGACDQNASSVLGDSAALASVYHGLLLKDGGGLCSTIDWQLPARVQGPSWLCPACHLVMHAFGLLGPFESSHVGAAVWSLIQRGGSA